MPRTIHVAITGNDEATGEQKAPLRTINAAANIARPGDTVIVHEGEYREWVQPRFGGLSDNRRITYCAAPDEHVVIKGSEIVSEWESTSDNVWKAVVPNSVFGTFNPFAEELSGDWVVRPNPRVEGPRRHLGAVYLNGRSLLEADSLEDLSNPSATETMTDDWTGQEVTIADPEWTKRRWFAEVGPENTCIWANFGNQDPREGLIEINVRPSVFMPAEHHIDYITVRGFELAQAATQWAPPTAFQGGLIGPNWAKGWIIENNRIHDAKCSAVSLGKEKSTGHNYATERQDKPGYQYQLESVFSARQIGWDKEHIGSHIVRGNEIYSCGQTGIVGHLGCIFSTIEDNHIHDIATDREFFGHEIAGIKLHAAIDVKIQHNHIHDCSLGIWLDWETQGTRISRNVMHSNCRDLFVEVSHGPYMVDNNVLASPASFESVSQGGAFLHNLIGGTIRVSQELTRSTPYHVAHSTQVAGYGTFCCGDDRWMNNVFVGGDRDAAYSAHGIGDFLPDTTLGTSVYDGCNTSIGELIKELDESSEGDHERYFGRRLPAYIRTNTYVGGPTPFKREEDPTVIDRESAKISVTLDEDQRGAILHLEEAAALDVPEVDRVTGVDLPPAYFPDAHYENADGTPATFDTDVLGNISEADKRQAGPFATNLWTQKTIKIW